MTNRRTNLGAAFAAFWLAVAIGAQDHGHATAGTPDKQSHAHSPAAQEDKSKASDHAQPHKTHLDEVNARGEHAMGFSQTATTHHFLLAHDGGAIQVEANAADDAANRDKIRTHLKHIASAFGDGNFHIPMRVHDQMPPGVVTMKRLKEKIAFVYEETARGGRVRISTADGEALAAVHEFLRFQIKDHQTGDPLEAPPQ